MKKILLTLTLTLSLGTSVFADLGTITFINHPTRLVTLHNTVSGNLGPMPATLGQFKFELFIAPAGTTDPSLFASTGIFGTNVAAPGRFFGGSNVGVPGVQAGETRAIMVRGWSTSLGYDYAEALSNWDPFFNGYLGESSVAPNFLFGGNHETGPIPASPMFSVAFGIQTSFALVGVPEPATGALVSLGLVGLILFRRKV